MLTPIDIDRIRGEAKDASRPDFRMTCCALCERAHVVIVGADSGLRCTLKGFNVPWGDCCVNFMLLEGFGSAPNLGEFPGSFVKSQC